MKLILPFKWILPYVPLLPCAQVEYIEAPQPFIMGFNSAYRESVDEVNFKKLKNIYYVIELLSL